MSESPTISPSKHAGSFANLLESFTAPRMKPSQSWDDSALEEDVAIISYEEALRAHRRVPAAASPANVPQFTPADPSPEAPAAGKTRKTASITIRLTKAEETQLHERAAAAQLSVSAYLRSCIFEAESLRTQVKEALSQMKAATTSDAQTHRAAQQKPALNWRTRLFPRWKPGAKTQQLRAEG